MGFWFFLLCCDLLIPTAMIICGRMMWKHAPDHINKLIGYRTSRSMKNKATWQFAHTCCGKLWWKMGWLLLLPSFLLHLPFRSATPDTLGCISLILVTVQIIFMLVSIFQTEKALKKTFDENGTRR